MTLRLMKNSNWVSFLFIVFAFFLYFYRYPSSFSAKNMATQEAPKSIYDFTVKVFFFLRFFGYEFYALCFVVLMEVYAFKHQLWLDCCCGLL